MRPSASLACVALAPFFKRCGGTAATSMGRCVLNLVPKQEFGPRKSPQMLSIYLLAVALSHSKRLGRVERHGEVMLEGGQDCVEVGDDLRVLRCRDERLA